MPASEPDTPMTKEQIALVKAENERQKHLPRGWHMCREYIHHIKNGGGMTIKYFVCYFKKKGEPYEESSMWVKTKEAATVLAGHLNKQEAIPAWVH